MQVTLKIFRYNPEVDKQFHYETYTIEAEETDRILDLLEHVKGYKDGTLSFRRSCAHGVCGSDAMRINGRNMLACKALVRDVGDKITVEPLLGLKVAKDLIVDMEPFFDNYKKVLPYFINDSPLPADGKERLQSPEQRARFDESTKCILCAACTTSCPSFWATDEYYGPAALVTAHRFIFLLEPCDSYLGVHFPGGRSCTGDGNMTTRSWSITRCVVKATRLTGPFAE